MGILAQSMKSAEANFETAQNTVQETLQPALRIVQTPLNLRSADHKDVYEEARKSWSPELRKLWEESPEFFKRDFPYTSVEIIAEDDGSVTQVKIISPKYVINGEKIERIKIPSFKYPYSIIHNSLVTQYTAIAQAIVKEGIQIGINYLED